MGSPLIRRVVITLAAMALGLCVVTGPASAAGGPAISYFKTAVPIIGSTLSDSSDQASFAIKDGWTIYDPSGVCSAYTNFYNSTTRTTTRIWNYSGSRSTTTATGKYQWTVQLGSYSSLSTYATNCLGNSSSGSGYASPDLAQEGAATYSAGWSSGSCLCWSGGAVLKSTKVGATANYSFYGRMVSLVSDKAPGRGSVSLYIDGKFQKTVSLSSASTVNRDIVWNSPYLSSSNHILTLKVASGRVDVDAFITQ